MGASLLKVLSLMFIFNALDFTTSAILSLVSSPKPLWRYAALKYEKYSQFKLLQERQVKIFKPLPISLDLGNIFGWVFDQSKVYKS